MGNATSGKSITVADYFTKEDVEVSLNCSKMQDLFTANNLDPIIAKLKRFNNQAKVKTKGGWNPNGFYQVIADKEILAYNPKSPGQCMPWLMWVICAGNTNDPELKLLKAFIDAGADVNIGWCGNTAFSACIDAGSLPRAKMLVESGAVPTMKHLDEFLARGCTMYGFETIKFLTKQKEKFKEGGLDEETRKSYYLLPEEEDSLIEVLANAGITAAEATAVMKDGVSSLKVVQHWLGVVNRLAAENDENIVLFRTSETMTIMSEIMKRYGAVDIHSVASDVLSALITIARNNTEEEKRIMGESGCIPPIFLMMEHSTRINHSGYSVEKKDDILEQCLTALVNITELEDNKTSMNVEKKPSLGSGYKYDLNDSWFEESMCVINPRFTEMLQMLKKGRN